MKWNMSTSEFLLEIRNLCKTYHNQNSTIFNKGRSIKVLKDISLYIKKGEIFGLVGESGCGKSTLGRSIVGLVKDVQGEILVHGKDINSIKKISKKIQIVFQDPLSSLNPKKKIGWILEEPLKIHKTGSKEQRLQRVNEVLELVGLDSSYRDRYPNELSGGQRQRISIGSALMLSPELIIADEPVSALDVSVQSQILNLLMDLHQKLNLSYLFISHNLDVVYYMCQRVAVMYLGNIVEFADVEDLYDNPLHPYTKALLNSIPEINIKEKKPDVNLQGEVSDSLAIDKGCSYYPRCHDAKALCREKTPELTCIRDRKGSEHFVRCHFTP